MIRGSCVQLIPIRIQLCSNFWRKHLQWFILRYLVFKLLILAAIYKADTWNASRHIKTKGHARYSAFRGAPLRTNKSKVNRLRWKCFELSCPKWITSGSPLHISFAWHWVSVLCLTCFRLVSSDRWLAISLWRCQGPPQEPRTHPLQRSLGALCFVMKCLLSFPVRFIYPSLNAGNIRYYQLLFQGDL